MSTDKNKFELQPNEQLTQGERALLDRACEAFRTRSPESVIAVGQYGYTLRGYGDNNSDTSIVFFLRRTPAQILNIDTSHHKKDEIGARNYVNALTSSISAEVGTHIGVAVIDERTLLMGLMNNDPYAQASVLSLVKTSKYVREHFAPVHLEFYNPFRSAKRCVDIASAQVKKILDGSNESNYRRERGYCGALWHILQALEHVTIHKEKGTYRNIRKLDELLTSARVLYPSITYLFDEDITKPFLRRTERGATETISPVDDSEVSLLADLIDDISDFITDYFKGEVYFNPHYDRQSELLVEVIDRSREYFNK